MRQVLRRWGLTVDRQVLGRALAKARRPKPRRLKRLPPLPQDSNHNLAAMLHYRTALARAFAKLGHEVARQVRLKLEQREKVAKAEGDDNDTGASDDAADWAVAGGIADSLDLSALTAVVDDTAQLGASVSGTTGRLALAQFGLRDNSDIVDQVDQRAADWADDRAAELVGMRYNADGELVPAARAAMRIDEPTRNMVRQLVYLGLQDGWRSAEIAHSIEHSYAFGEDRAALIANTEIRRAHSQGALIGYQQAAAGGISVLKEWDTSGDNPCDDCELNEQQGAIPLGQTFQSGEDAPPAHPNCRCSIVPVVTDAGFGGNLIPAAAARELTQTEKDSVDAAVTGGNMSFDTGARNPFDNQTDLFHAAYHARDTLSSWLTGETSPLAGLAGLRFYSAAPDSLPPSAFQTPGTMLFAVGVKKQTRAAEKVAADYKGDWTRLLDSYRTTLAVDSPEEARQVAANLVKTGLAVRVKDTFAHPLEDSHWRDIKINIRMPNGLIGEVAIIPKPMLVAKNIGHDYYEITRTIEAKYTVAGNVLPKSEWAPADLDKWRIYMAKQAELYDAAWHSMIDKGGG